MPAGRCGGEQELAPCCAGGLEPPIDTVWTGLRDAEGFAASAEHAAAVGFGGKLCIHPNQIAAVHAAFTPSAAEVGVARRVVRG